MYTIVYIIYKRIRLVWWKYCIDRRLDTVTGGKHFIVNISSASSYSSAIHTLKRSSKTSRPQLSATVASNFCTFCH